MMNTWREKLKSNRGASMILAMALFLVCVMVSSIIIATASSGTSRNLRRTTQQQSYLAVSSATDLLVEEFQMMGSFAGKTTEKRYGCEDCTISAGVTNGYWLDASLIPNTLNEGYIIYLTGSHGDSGTKVTVDEEATTLQGPLADLMLRATEEVYVKHVPYTEEFTIALDDADEERLPEVICTFKMNEDYKVTIDIGTENSDYAVRLTAEATVTNTETSDTDISCSHAISYKELVDGAFVDHSDTLTITGEYKEAVVTVTWSSPKVVKGVGSK